MNTAKISDEIREKYRYAIQKAREDRPKYYEWLKNEIEIGIELINRFDKKYILGGLGSKLIKSTPTLFNQFIEGYSGPGAEEITEDEFIQNDDQIEVLLEYAMSLSTATKNKSDKIPSQEDIDRVYSQLSKIKSNINFWELSADNPDEGGVFDHWLRTHIMLESINVRGDGYHKHIEEIFSEIFNPHNGFLEQYYGFNAIDVFGTMEKLTNLVFSKVGNLDGAYHGYKRFTEWIEKKGYEEIKEEMSKTGKHFIRLFTEANPDLYNESNSTGVTVYNLNQIDSYPKIFWVIPKNEKEKLIFERLSIQFGNNESFFQPPRFKGFPLNDSSVKQKPLIKEGN